MLRVIAMLGVFLLLWCQNVDAAAVDRQAAVAVMDFGTRPGATTAEININNAEYTSSEYIIAGLLRHGCFVIMDKDMVMEKLREEGIKTVGIIDPDTAKRIGAILKVKYLVYGNVTNVSVSDTGTAIIGNIGGGVNVCTVKAHIIARVMDISTGDIIMAAKGDGKSKSSFVKVQAGGNIANVNVINIGSVKVTMDSVHNAIQKAAYCVADNIFTKVSS